MIEIVVEELGTGGSEKALDTIVDTARYPLWQPEDGRLVRTIRKAREDLAASGCARIEGFVRPEAQICLTRETEDRAPSAHVITQCFTPYGTDAKEGFPPDHPQRRMQSSTNGFVAGDLIDGATMIKRLYRSDAFMDFVAACLGKSRIHRFADPIRNLVINVMRCGTEFAWHFDANEFIVSLMTKAPESGGVFEYCPDIRAPGDENYDAVQAVLDGDRRPVRCLELEVGDLQLFKGRYAMHRVARTTGERHTVLFGFSEIPGYIGALESTRVGYDRVTRLHIDAEKRRHDDGLAVSSASALPAEISIKFGAEQ